MSSSPLPEPSRAEITLVVVDDHPIVRDGLVGLLGSQPGLRIVGEAADGAEALQVVAHRRPEVVVMDLRMPGVGGVEAIRRLRAQDREHPRILVLTTYDTDSEIREALQAGADGFLLKDAGRDELVRAVQEVAAGRPVLTRAALTALSALDRAEPDPVPLLSPRERQVLGLVAEGLTNRAVAARLRIGEATVKTHLLHVYDKLQVSDRASAVNAAWRHGLV